MRQRKYTLPRHTNLANIGPRIGAFFIDLAIMFALSLGFFFGCFSLLFKSKTEPLGKTIEEQRLATKLFFLDESGNLAYFGQGIDNNFFKDSLCYFYTVYIPEVDVGKDDPVKLDDGTSVLKKEYFTVEWFNKEMLKVEGDGQVYFEYQVVDEVVRKDLLANIKAPYNGETSEVNSFLQTIWANANYDLNHLASFQKLNNEYGFLFSLEFVLSGFIGSVAAYIVMPLIFKNGTTVGKKLFHLCLADKDGYLMQNYQLFLRIIPLLLVISFVLVPIWADIVYIILFFVMMFLISFGLAMASPKRSSLHDFVGRTIVVDAKTSILFANAMDEEKYIAKEDGLEVSEEDEYTGEEPKLRYEK